jgi:hypothetical protein
MLILGSLPTAKAQSLEMVLSWHDGHRLFPYDLSQVTREVESIFEATGVDIRWKLPGKPTLPLESDVNVVLIPSDPGGPGWQLPSDAMGACVYDNGKKQSVYIFAKNVMRAIRLNPHEDRILSLLERRSLSRALGRVLAHEVVHAVAPSLQHSPEGLMSEGLDIRFLTKKRIRISADSGTAFVSGLRVMKDTTLRVADRSVSASR